MFPPLRKKVGEAEKIGRRNILTAPAPWLLYERAIENREQIKQARPKRNPLSRREDSMEPLKGQN